MCVKARVYRMVSNVFKKKNRIFHFSAIAGKYSPILGYNNQQDQARWSYL